MGMGNNTNSRNQNEFLMKHKSSNFSNNMVGGNNHSNRGFSDSDKNLRAS